MSNDHLDIIVNRALDEEAAVQGSTLAADEDWRDLYRQACSDRVDLISLIFAMRDSFDYLSFGRRDPRLD